jgi:TPP-dependent pyruvate/acetoin dehydrogenase alpha subunit
MAGSSTDGGSLIDDAKLKQLYASMLQCRLLTEHARRWRPSKVFYDASMGQEAIVTGCAIDLRPEDTIALAPHDSIPNLVRGVALSEVVAQLHARRGNTGRVTHNTISAASSDSSDQGELLQLASNVALANKQKKNANVVVAFTGAAATTHDYWLRAIKFASRRSLPIMFVMVNNPWAVRAGGKASNGTGNLTLKVQKDGLTSITVDGNDVVAVYRVACESLVRMRRGGGPVLVEGKTYRQDGQALLSIERDPLIHMERYLKAKKLFTTGWKNNIARQFSRELDAAVQGREVQPTRYLRASQPTAND